MAALSQGASCSFNGVSFEAVSVRVESPSAELVDMTGMSDGSPYKVLIPTGGNSSSGSVTVEALSPAFPIGLLQQKGQLSFSSAGGSVSVNAICTSVSLEAKVGDLIRSVITFVPTDYYG